MEQHLTHTGDIHQIHSPDSHKTNVLFLGVVPEEGHIPAIEDLQSAGWAVGLALLEDDLSDLSEAIFEQVDMIVYRPHAKTGNLFKIGLSHFKRPKNKVFVDIRLNKGFGPAEDSGFLTVELADADGCFGDFIAKRQEVDLSSTLEKILSDSDFFQEKQHARPIDFAEENKMSLMPEDVALVSKARKYPRLRELWRRVQPYFDHIRRKAT